MKLKNTQNSYGLIAILIHWIMAILIIGLFVLGNYMTGLDYYDPFYHEGPWWHKSFGLVVAMFLIARIIWKIINPKVAPLANTQNYEVKIAKMVHVLLYLLIIVCCVSGVLISTAEGAGIDFFNFFELPAIVSNGEAQIELAEDIHFYATWGLILLAGLHLLAALKHHFLNKDRTLMRILTTRGKT